MLGGLLRELEARFPWLSIGFRTRRDAELPAFLISLTMHGILLMCLAFAGYHVQLESSREFQGGVVDNLMLSSDSTFQDLDQSTKPPSPIAAAGTFAPLSPQRSRLGQALLEVCRALFRNRLRQANWRPNL